MQVENAMHCRWLKSVPECIALQACFVGTVNVFDLHTFVATMVDICRARLLLRQHGPSGSGRAAKSAVHSLPHCKVIQLSFSAMNMQNHQICVVICCDHLEGGICSAATLHDIE